MATRDSEIEHTEINRTEIDGVTTWWAPGPGPFLASLTFRIGVADETLSQRGLTHLVEHLTMPDHRRHHFDCNASVNQTRTEFWARGRVDEVVQFLEDRIAMLNDLPLDRLETERGILQTEEEGRRSSAYETALIEYFGARGYGLDAYPQYRIGEADRDELVDWAARFFTRENAVLSLSGPPPAGLAIDLPSGTRIPPPRPEPVPELPATRYWGSGGGFTAVGLVQRTAAATIASRLLVERIQQELRYGQGLSYSVYGDYERWTVDHAFVTIWPDVADGKEQDALGHVLSCLDSLTADGALEDELEHWLEGLRRTIADPEAVNMWIESAAHDDLIGGTVYTKDEQLARQEAVTPADVARAASELASRLLWIVPETVEMPEGRAALVPGVSSWQVDGRVFRRARSRLGRREGGEQIVVGGEGISLLLPGYGPVSVRYDEVSALVHHGDSDLELIGGDGFRIVFGETGSWSHEEELRRVVTERVPAEKHVRFRPEPTASG